MSTLRNRTKAEPQRSGMTHAKWREVQSIHRKSAAKYVFGPRARSKDWPSGRPGTYNVGRNAAKRARRLAARAE